MPDELVEILEQPEAQPDRLSAEAKGLRTHMGGVVPAAQLAGLGRIEVAVVGGDGGGAVHVVGGREREEEAAVPAEVLCARLPRCVHVPAEYLRGVGLCDDQSRACAGGGPDGT